MAVYNKWFPVYGAASISPGSGGGGGSDGTDLLDTQWSMSEYVSDAVNTFEFAYDFRTVMIPLFEYRFRHDGSGVERTIRPYRRIGQGTQGFVVEYIDTQDPQKKYAVKIGVSEVDDKTETEIDVIKELLSTGGGFMPCGITSTRGLNSHTSNQTGLNIYYIMMEYMDGDLLKLMFEEEISYQIASDIIESVYQQLKCILAHIPNQIYFDLKVQNIGFKQVGTERTYKLIDFGSFARNQEGAVVGTYPCLPNQHFRRKFRVDDNGNEYPGNTLETCACTAYQLGILFASLIGIPTKDYSFKVIGHGYGLGQEDAEKRAQELYDAVRIKLIGENRNLAYTYLVHPNPEIRISSILETLNGGPYDWKETIDPSYGIDENDL